MEVIDHYKTINESEREQVNAEWGWLVDNIRSSCILFIRGYKYSRLN